MTARGAAVMKKMILQLIKKIQMRAMIICPRAQPIESTIGDEVLSTFYVTYEIDSREAL